MLNRLPTYCPTRDGQIDKLKEDWDFSELMLDINGKDLNPFWLMLTSWQTELLQRAAMLDLTESEICAIFSTN